jgi:hypothetical protein
MDEDEASLPHSVTSKHETGPVPVETGLFPLVNGS